MNKIKYIYWRYGTKGEMLGYSLEEVFKKAQLDIEWNEAAPVEIWDGEDLVWSDKNESIYDAARQAARLVFGILVYD